ncbi:HET-domain-containing protein, partial [Glonium stellatum]
MEPQELIVSENVPARHVHEIYTNLDRGRREIRLISVTPGEWSDEINCEFTVASLDDRPEYYALSYTWGDPTITRPIIINGVRKQATVSLESALRRLRETAEPSIMIWIDALCINQEDSVERSHQVGMMGDIYRFTREALIWIGE